MSEFEHKTLTPWGYFIDSEALPDFITTTEFVNFTNNKFGNTDTRIVTNIGSATASIRNFCGWHISPVLTCGMVYNVHDLRDAFVGSDLIIQLPAGLVHSVDKVVLNAVLNTETGDYEGEIVEPDRVDFGMGDGLVTIYDVGCLDRRSKIFIKYVAGYPDTQMSAIKELVANGVTHSLTNTFGVNSEAAGGVSVSYNAAWSSQGSTALSNDTRETLEFYKVKGVF